MNICTNCGVEMRCSRTGVMVLFNPGWAYNGDEFRCYACESLTITTGNSGGYTPSAELVAVYRSHNRLLDLTQETDTEAAP